MRVCRFRTGFSIAVVLVLHNSPLEGQPVLYEHPGTADVTVRTEVVEDGGRKVDLYYPPHSGDQLSPIVVFVLSFPDSVFGPLRAREPYPSWARLVAAEGFVGVLYETSQPEGDLGAVMRFLLEQSERLAIDPNRVALWSASGNTPLALKYVRVPSAIKPAALIAYYGLMPTPDQYQAAALDSMSARFGFTLPNYGAGERYPKDLPILIVRAGLDSWREILNSIDRFAEFTLHQNLRVTLWNYPEGQHGFDFRDDTVETRAIIRDTLTYLRDHLRDGSAGESELDR